MYAMYQLDKKEPSDRQIQDILRRHIAKYGPPPFILEVHPSVEVTPCQDVAVQKFQHVQPWLALLEVKEKEEIA